MRNMAMLLFASALLAGCDTPPPAQLTGTLAGDLRFTATSPALQAYLSMHRAVATGPVVRFSPPGAGVVAATAYDTTSPGSNAPLSGSSWKLAGYQATLPVAGGGSAFLVEVNALTFDGGGNYRFGFRSAGTVASHQSPAIAPQANVQYDVEECAAMVTARVKLTGTEADLAPLRDTPGQTYACVVDAAVDDGGNGSRNPQARSTLAMLDHATLTSGDGATLTFPVRALGQATTFTASCGTRPPAGAGYAVDNQGNAGFSSAVSASVAVACNGPATTLDLPIPVRRTAGDATGRFDIVGYPERDAQVSLAPPGSQARNTAPAPLPSEQPTPATWTIAGAPAGPAEVTAGAAIAGGDLGLQLPALRAPNPVATVPAGSPSLDLGATFVTRPVASAGTLFLVDPARSTWLAKLANTGPVSWNADSTDTSFLQFNGSDRLVDDAPGSAVGGISIGRLNGAYDPTQGCLLTYNQGCWELQYRLLFAGLSPAAGRLDGSDARRTAWDVDSATLNFQDPALDHQQKLNVRFSRDMRVYTAGDGLAPPLLRTLGMCMGQVEIELVADAATGRLFAPLMAHSQATVTNPGTPADVLSSSGYAYGRPAAAASAAQSARIVATVPDGAAYRLQPQVSILPPGGGPATAVSGLASVLLPASGTLSCSRVDRACIRINGTAGSSSQLLQVSVGAAPYCRPAGGTVTLQVSVESGGVPVDSIDYRIDGGPPINYCSNCGVLSAASPFTLTPAGQPLAMGGHTIEISAHSQNGCSASSAYAFDACVPANSTRQLAFFDSGYLKLLRLEDNQLQFAPLAVDGGSGPIAFNADGSKLTVNQGAQLRTFASSDGADLGSESGSFLAFAYRPGAGSGDDRATVQAGAPPTLHYVLGNVAGTVTLPGSSPASGVDVAGHRLAWSRDGARLALAFTRQAGSETRLVVQEWRAGAGNTLAASTSSDWLLPADAQLRAFAYETAGEPRFVVATSNGLYRVAGGFLQPLAWQMPLLRADVHRSGLWAVAPAGAPVAASLLGDFGATADPVPGEVLGLAVSDYFAPAQPLLAVARFAPQLQPDQVSAITLYRLAAPGGAPALVAWRQLRTGKPEFPVFRPLPP